MDTPKRLCECQDIKETETILDTRKATKLQRHLVGLAFRMTEPEEKKKALEAVEESFKETEGSHQSDGDGLPTPPSAKPSQTSHEMSGTNQFQEMEFDMSSCVSQAIANGASPEQARAQCSTKRGTMEMVKEALKPYLGQIKETQTTLGKIQEAIKELDGKVQETVKTKTKTLEFTKPTGPGGNVRETTVTPQPPQVKSATELMDARREIISDNNRLHENGGTVYH